MCGRYCIDDSMEGLEAMMEALSRRQDEGAVTAARGEIRPTDVAHIRDRMPVIVPEELAGEWLSPDGDAQAVLGAAAYSVVYGAAL